MAFFCGIWFVAIIYKKYIHPMKENEYIADYSNTNIEKQYIDIMELYLNGYSWNKIRPWHSFLNVLWQGNIF